MKIPNYKILFLFLLFSSLSFAQNGYTCGDVGFFVPLRENTNKKAKYNGTGSESEQNRVKV